MSLTQHIAKDGFRLRGTEMSRIDAFSDVVFGFALTLIVVSLEVPKTIDELLESTRGFIPFFICFVFLILLWYEHFRFFRRYNLHDAATITINAGLLFTLLFYIYPLKFLFTLLTGEFLGIEAMQGHVENYHQITHLMVLYGMGFSAIYGCYALLYWNAKRQQETLGLNERERFITRAALIDNAVMALIGIVAAIVAVALGPRAGIAGFFFILIGPWKTWWNSLAASRAKRIPLETKPS